MKTVILVLNISFILFILGCNSDNTAGGATDIGNGVVYGTTIIGNDSNAVITLATNDYLPNKGIGQIFFDTVNNNEQFIFTSLPEGFYRLWIGTNTGSQFISHEFEILNDSIVFQNTQPVNNSSLIIEHSFFDTINIPTKIYIPGTALIRPIKIDTNNFYHIDSLPAGTYPMLFTDSISVSEILLDSINTTAGQTTTFTLDYSLNKLPEHPNSNYTSSILNLNDSIWCGTDQGLGYFTQNKWDFNSKNLNSIADCKISDIIQISDSLILASNKGLIVENETTWEFITSSISELPDDSVIKLHLKGDSLWILTNTGLATHKENTVTQQFENDTTLPSSGLTNFAITNAGEIWLSSFKSGLYKYNGLTWEKQTPFPEIDTVEISTIVIDSTGTLWISTIGEGVYYYNGSIWGNMPLLEADGSIDIMLENKDGDMWLGSTKGDLLLLSGSTLNHVAQLSLTSQESSQFLSFENDILGDLIIGSNGNGIFKLCLN